MLFFFFQGGLGKKLCGIKVKGGCLGHKEKFIMHVFLNHYFGTLARCTAT